MTDIRRSAKSLVILFFVSGKRVIINDLPCPIGFSTLLIVLEIKLSTHELFVNEAETFLETDAVRRIYE